MRHQQLLLVAVAASIASPVALAQEATTKREIIERSGPICRDALEAVQPHLRRMQRATEERRFRAVVRHGRGVVRTARPYVRQLDELSPESDGRTRYRRYVDNAFSMLDWIDAAMDALANRRGRLAERRVDEALEVASIARRAARRFGLRDPCITLVS